VNGDDIKWLEKLFEQHKEDQQKYLEDKFDSLNASLINLDEVLKLAKADALDLNKIRVKDCKDCRLCLNSNIADLDRKIEEADKKSTKKVAVGSIGAVFISIVLWTAYGAGAIDLATSVIKFIF
jgi:hypothetical protein